MNDIKFNEIMIDFRRDGATVVFYQDGELLKTMNIRSLEDIEGANIIIKNGAGRLLLAESEAKR